MSNTMWSIADAIRADNHRKWTELGPMGCRALLGRAHEVIAAVDAAERRHPVVTCDEYYNRVAARELIPELQAFMTAQFEGERQ